MSELERVNKIVKWLIFLGKADNIKELSDNLGYSYAAFNNVLNGKKPLSDRFISRLITLDDRIRIKWVKTGKGEMINRLEYVENVSYLKGIIQQQKEQINKLLDILKEKSEK